MGDFVFPVLVALLAYFSVPWLLYMAGFLAAEVFGVWRPLLWLQRAAVLLPGARPALLLLEDVPALRELGRMSEVLARMRALRPLVPGGTVSLRFVNIAVEHFVTAGCYGEALDIGNAVPAAQRDEAFGLEAASWALVQINMAEAEYDQGCWKAALHRVESSYAAAAPFAICRTGLLTQRAWILAHLGRGAEALSTLKLGARRDLPLSYRSEYDYTEAVALLAVGRPKEAEDRIRHGMRCARRRSSIRNGLSLLARVAAHEGRWADAERFCREAADHPHRTQGGDGLLLWGDVLVRLERAQEARVAWSLAVERDPESEAAATAKERLAAGSDNAGAPAAR